MTRTALVVGLGLSVLATPAFAQLRNTSPRAEACRQETRNALRWEKSARFLPRIEQERRAYFRRCLRRHA